MAAQMPPRWRRLREGHSAMAGKKAKPNWRRHWPRLFFLIPCLMILWVPSYNRIEPTLAGVPFFYWYQLAWILIGAAVVALVYVLERKSAHAAKIPGDDMTGFPGDTL
jgi:hypothetical protein